MTFTLSFEVPARLVLAAELMLIFLDSMSTDGAGLDRRVSFNGIGLARGGIGGGVANELPEKELSRSLHQIY
ncbi:unnamed protein product [Heligmosomoides polygyrus]|uniref:Secreted protein n=1 Tax=Heligmosomoides polygyrus TaxID=6339 RepID=A0A183FF90_HELPZ|nr:unnamed protein product [Heligmosomoides polygyrus]